MGAGHNKLDGPTPPTQTRHRLRNDARILVWTERAEHEDRLPLRFVGPLWFVIGPVGDVSNVAGPVPLHQVTAIVVQRDHHQIGPTDKPCPEGETEPRASRAK